MKEEGREVAREEGSGEGTAAVTAAGLVVVEAVDWEVAMEAGTAAGSVEVKVAGSAVAMVEDCNDTEHIQPTHLTFHRWAKITESWKWQQQAQSWQKLGLFSHISPMSIVHGQL